MANFEQQVCTIVSLCDEEHFVRKAVSLQTVATNFDILLYGGSPPPTLQLAREQVGAAPPYNRMI